MKRIKPIKRLLLIVLVIYIAWCGALYFAQDSLMFPASLAGPGNAGPGDDRTIVLHTPIDGGKLVEAWFIPAPAATEKDPAPVVAFFHGNAELIDHQMDMVSGYHDLGISVLLPEFRGYGRSEGKATETAIVNDALKFIDMIRRRSDVDGSALIIHGRSIGGAIAAQVAAKQPPAALILQSTLYNAAKKAHHFGAPAILLKNPMRTDRAVTSLDIPMLFFHGTHDRIIPPTHGRDLSRLVPHARYIEYDTDHNHFPGPGNGADYWRQIESLLRETKMIE